MKAWPWLLIALISSTALAADYAQSEVPGPNWQTVALAFVAITTSLIGVYAKGMQSRLDRLETFVTGLATRITDIDKVVARDYHTKVELQNMMDRALKPFSDQLGEQSKTLTAVHKRLDNLHAQRAE